MCIDKACGSSGTPAGGAAYQSPNRGMVDNLLTLSILGMMNPKGLKPLMSGGAGVGSFLGDMYGSGGPGSSNSGFGGSSGYVTPGGYRSPALGIPMGPGGYNNPAVSSVSRGVNASNNASSGGFGGLDPIALAGLLAPKKPNYTPGGMGYNLLSGGYYNK